MFDLFFLLLKMSNLFQIVESIVTIAGILAALGWFYQRRQQYPRALIKHEIEHRYLSRSHVFVRVKLVIENIGNIQIRLSSAYVDVETVSPAAQFFLKEAALGKKFKDDGDEIAWPFAADRREEKFQRLSEIEPGEEEELIFDFILTHSIETLSVSSHIENSKIKPIGWCKTSLYDLDSK